MEDIITRNNCPLGSLRFSWEFKIYTYKMTGTYNNGKNKSGNWSGEHINA